MAAITSTMMLFDAGSHFVMTDDVYGGTYRLATKVLNRFNLDYTYVDTSFPAKVEAAIRKNTKALFIETPTNPLLNVTNITKMAEIAKKHDLLLLVDNTFATPYWQHTLYLDVDIVLHCTTQHLG